MRALAALLLLASCTHRSLEVPGAVAPSTYDEFASDYAQAICAHYVSCGLMDVAQTDACIAFTLDSELPVPPEPRAGLASGGYVYDSKGAATCLATVAMAACVFPALPCRAHDVLHAASADGEPCRLDATCESGACHCLHGGVCGAPTAVGDLCTYTCVAGAACLGELCAPVADGDACIGICADGLECIARHMAQFGDEGICRAPGPIGSPCTPYDGDLSGHVGCADATACDFTLATPNCVALADLGERCGSIYGCTPGLACVGLDVTFSTSMLAFAPGGAPGTCELPPVLGGPCTSGTLDSCPALTACVNHICTATPTLGESCAARAVCVASFCDPQTATCVPSIALGQPCDASTGNAANDACQQSGSGYEDLRRFCDGFAAVCDTNARSCGS